MQVNFDSFGESIEEDVVQEEFMHVDDNGNRHRFDTQEELDAYKRSLWAEENPELAAEMEKAVEKEMAKIRQDIKDRDFDRKELAAARKKAQEIADEIKDRYYSQYAKDIESSKSQRDWEEEQDDKWYNKLNPFYDKQKGDGDAMRRKRGAPVQGETWEEGKGS